MSRANAQLFSFMDLFDNPFLVNGKGVCINQIAVPAIQRDYAQGRKTAEANRVRKKFLEVLHRAVADGNPIQLDFVYGSIDEDGTLILLDGQQRLTTLFLLHWYLAKKEGVSAEDGKYALLKNFTYKIRYSSREFCSRLLEYTPVFDQPLSEQLINQYWFSLSWKKDPTVQSMLVMLDAINGKFSETQAGWQKLCGGAVTFYFLGIECMGLTDELYIKMNSRGKPLTLFEHFKAELNKQAEKLTEKGYLDSGFVQCFFEKIDNKWTDFFWKYRDANAFIDDKFLRFIRFVCDVLSYLSGKIPDSSADELELLDKFFACHDEQKADKTAAENYKELERIFDCWCSIEGYESPENFLPSFIIGDKETVNQKGERKIAAKEYGTIFQDCLNTYGGNSFTLKNFIFLYAVTCYLKEQKDISSAWFVRRIRMINNLIANSEYEIRAERMAEILEQTKYIIMNGKITDEISLSFNEHQLKEEIWKRDFLKKCSLEEQEIVFALEDYELLHGQISVLLNNEDVSLERLKIARRFISLFKCDRDKINCALMACGDFSQRISWWQVQFGSSCCYNDSAWKTLFHRPGHDDFEKTRRSLYALLEKYEEFDDDKLQKISDDYLNECKNNKVFPLEYYYIKYNSFREVSEKGKFRGYGNYVWTVLKKERYTADSYIPYLKEAASDNLDKDYYGERLKFDDFYVICEEDAYSFHKHDGTLLDKCKIKQKDDIDIEDRVELLIGCLKEKGVYFSDTVTEN